MVHYEQSGFSSTLTEWLKYAIWPLLDICQHRHALGMNGSWSSVSCEKMTSSPSVTADLYPLDGDEKWFPVRFCLLLWPLSDNLAGLGRTLI
jgi:hypothetical protein